MKLRKLTTFLNFPKLTPFMKRLQIFLISFIFLISIASSTGEQIYPFGYGGGGIMPKADGWDQVHDYFDFTCSGAADLPSTECYGANPEGTGYFDVVGAYSLVKFDYSCEPYNYDGGCWHGDYCAIWYDGQLSMDTVEVQGPSESLVNSTGYFTAKLMQGDFHADYQCYPCGHGEWVYYVRPTKCEVDVYVKGYASCDDFCKDSFTNSYGTQEGEDCNCYCNEQYEPYQYENGAWICNFVYDEEIVKEQLKKDFHECVFAVQLYKHMTLYATVDQGQLQPAYYEDISDNIGLAVPKWLWKSGCTAYGVGLPVDVCLAQHCVSNYRTPLEEMGGSVSMAEYDVKEGSSVEQVEDTVIQIDYGSLHTYSPGTTVVTPTIVSYQESEAVFEVSEDGSTEIFLLEGTLGLVSSEDSVTLSSGEKTEVDSSGAIQEPESFSESEVDQWWDSSGDDFDLDDFLGDIHCCGGPVFILLSLLAIIRKTE